MRTTLCLRLTELIVIGLTFIHALCPSVVYATETLNGNAVINGVTDQRKSVSGDNSQNVHKNMQRSSICERCLQNENQKVEGTRTSNQQRRRNISLKTDGNPKSVPTAGSQGANKISSRTSHGQIVFPKKRQLDEESAIHTQEPRKLNRAHLQTLTAKKGASTGTPVPQQREGKLIRMSDSQRTRQEYNNIHKIFMQSKIHLNLEIPDNKGHAFGQLINKDRGIKDLNKNTKDGFNKLSASKTIVHNPKDAGAGPTEQFVADRQSENDKLQPIHRINVEVIRTGKSKQNGPSVTRNSLQLSDLRMMKLSNKSLLAKDHNKFKSSKVALRTSFEDKSSSRNLGIKTGQANVQELRSITNHETTKKNGFHRSQDVSMNDKYFADEVRDGPVSDMEWAHGQRRAARERGEHARNRLVRPSAADRIEQRISQDLTNSYHRLMVHIQKILQMFLQSMQKLKSYKAEIFNGTRYTIMMGAIDVIKELHEANHYIYDGVTSATQFTREVLLKYHNSQHASKSGKVQKAPTNLTGSEVVKRNFQPNLDQAHREHNKVQTDMGKINEMKMKCLQGESRLKQVQDLFLTNYDRSIIKDLYGYLNTSIHRINRGLKISPQLSELRRRKYYLDHVKGVLTRAKSLLINSTNAFQNAVEQTKENYDTFKNWLDKQQSKHRGFPRSSSQDLNSYHFGKLQQLVSQATEHAHELQRQYNRLHSILNSPLEAAKAVVSRTEKTAVQFELKHVTTNLKLLLKDMLSSLDELRIHIGSKIKLALTKRCRSDTEGSGNSDTDDEDLCEEEGGSGLEISDSEKMLQSDNEDFTFIDEPVENTHLAEHSLRQLGVDLADFTSKLFHRSRQIYDNAQTLQPPLAGLQRHLSNMQSSVSSVERSTETQKNVLLDFHDNTRHVQEVKQKIPDISQKIAALRKLNLEDAVDKAKRAVERSRQSSQVNRTQSFEATFSNAKIIDEDRAVKTDKMDDQFDYSGLFEQGQETVSNYADLTLLQSLAVESCEKIGNHFTYIRRNMSLLRQKVEKAREILTTLKLSVSKSGDGYVSMSIPETHVEITASLTSSIKACVKPKTLDGPLLFVRGNNSASYGIMLNKGNIALTAYDKENNDLKTLALDELSITEEWYTLEIQRTGETLSVMAVSQTGKMQTKREMIGGLDLIQPSPLTAYLGGMPESLGIISGSWEGCVGNLMVNEMALTLFSSDSKGIQPTLCTDHCISDKQVLPMVFNGNGFAQFIPSEMERITSITLNFKTRQNMASLLSLINRRQNSYLSVVMDNGAVKIERSSPGENIVLLSLTSSLNDGQSHLLKVRYRDNKIYPELDGNREAFSVERTAPQIFTNVLDGVLIGALIFHSRQFHTTPYRPLIGCISDVFINDDRLVLPDAVDRYNVFHGYCSSSDIWHSCFQWTDQSKTLSLGVVDNSNRISLLVSRNSLGSLIHFIKKDTFDIVVTLTVSGIDASSDNSEGVMVRPATDKSYFTLITIIDDGSYVYVKAWDQSVSFSYGGFWSLFSKDLSIPHTVVIGESRDGQDRTVFTGSISQFTIEDRFYDLRQFSLSHNLLSCELPQENIRSPPVVEKDEPFPCN